MRELKSPSKRWGIVVGVDKYEYANDYLHDLHGCVIDANKMYDTMMDEECCGFLKDHVQLLVNPCFDELEEAFASVGEKIRAGDELWFYFAGHGYSDRNRSRDNGYLLLTGAKYDKRGFLRSEGSMSRDQLGDLVGQHIKVGGVTVVFFLDCCCAASVGLNTGDRAVQEVSELEDIATSFGAMRTRDLNIVSDDCETEPMRYISLCATGKYGRAREDQDGGAFTKRLVEGLMGGTSSYPTAIEDIYVTAGLLGNYVGAKMTVQGPRQNISDPTYPLSISPGKKRIADQHKAMDGNVREWLANFTGEVLDKQFAELVLMHKVDFEFAEIMRKVLRIVSDPNCALRMDGEESASLLKAFHSLKNLLDRSDSPGSGAQTSLDSKKVGAVKSAIKSKLTDTRMGQVPLTACDRELLADVAERMRDVDGEGAELLDIGRKSQGDAVLALNAMARERMRRMGAPLFGKDERDAWDMKSMSGFSSAVEAAVYEIVKDDKALAVRKR